MWHAEFRGWLEERMAERGLRTDTELARLAGVPQTTASNWRRGFVRPNRANCARIAIGFEVALEEVLAAAGFG
jgi:transcriptional regulator with XRE-family HTH domain